MIVDMQSELRDFTYITNLYKCIANYNLMGHQIGRKVGDMLEILTMGVIYQSASLKAHLDTEGKLEGYTSAGHKVEFGFFADPRKKTGLFGAIECKCVGVEETKFTSGHLKTLSPNGSFDVSLYGQWMEASISATVRLISVSDDQITIEIKNSKDSRRQQLSLSTGDNVKLIVDENGQFLNTTPHGNMLTEIPGIIRICKTIKVDKISASGCTFSLWNCLTGPQTIEKAKQASLVAMDLRKKIDGHWGREDVSPENKAMTFLHILCEFSHWEEKSRNVIRTCIDHNFVVPDEILIYAFQCFENRFGTADMLPHISKKKFETDSRVRSVIHDVLAHFENHIFYDIESGCYVTIDCTDHSMCVIPI